MKDIYGVKRKSSARINAECNGGTVTLIRFQGKQSTNLYARLVKSLSQHMEIRTESIVATSVMWQTDLGGISNEQYTYE